MLRTDCEKKNRCVLYSEIIFAWIITWFVGTQIYNWPQTSTPVPPQKNNWNSWDGRDSTGDHDQWFLSVLVSTGKGQPECQNMDLQTGSIVFRCGRIKRRYGESDLGGLEGFLQRDNSLWHDNCSCPILDIENIGILTVGNGNWSVDLCHRWSAL